MMSRPQAVVVAPRSPALKPLITSLSHVVVGSGADATLERILPAGRVHLMVNLHEDEFRTYDGRGLSRVRRTRGAVLEGPHSVARVIDTRPRCLVAVNFTFGGAVPFFLAEPANNGWESPTKIGTTTVRVEVFVDDPDGFVKRAVEAGADGSRDPVRDHQAPWGKHRQGGFFDPFGHLWLVGDRSPLKRFP